MTDLDYNYLAKYPELDQTIEVLTRARELISEEHRWTQYAYARDKEGICVESTSPKAACWCARGAINRVVHSPDGYVGHESDLLSASQVALGNMGPYDRIPWPRSNILNLNDAEGTMHADVLERFDVTIERLKAARGAYEESMR